MPSFKEKQLESVEMLHTDSTPTVLQRQSMSESEIERTYKEVFDAFRAAVSNVRGTACDVCRRMCCKTDLNRITILEVGKQELRQFIAQRYQFIINY